MPDQLPLFDFQLTTASKEPTLKIGLESFQQWKTKVINFQKDIGQPQQTSAANGLDFKSAQDSSLFEHKKRKSLPC